MDNIEEIIEAPEVIELPKFSGKLQNIFPDGTVQYDDQIGLPSEFPLTEAELQEVNNP
jgi:hypothetical protein